MIEQNSHSDLGIVKHGAEFRRTSTEVSVEQAQAMQSLAHLQGNDVWFADIQQELEGIGGNIAMSPEAMAALPAALTEIVKREFAFGEGNARLAESSLQKLHDSMVRTNPTAKEEITQLFNESFLLVRGQYPFVQEGIA